MQMIEACLSRAAKCALSLGLLLGLGTLCDVKPAEASDAPGSILRVWPLEGGGPGAGDAFRILYRSTGLSGQAIEVSGAIFIPPGAAPPGGRNVIAWAHPTSGVVEACAPSLMPDVSGMIWGLADMLRQGYVVVATDYPGLGVPGMIHPYLIGVSEGRAVLDSVRAARAMPDAGASNRFAVWGHSQGGHASLYTGELAASYAPDLKLVGVAAAAPATYLAELFDADKSSPGGKDLTAMTIYSWSRLLNKPAGSIVTPAAMPAYERIARDCIESIVEFQAITEATKPLAGEQFLKPTPPRSSHGARPCSRTLQGRCQPARRCSWRKAPPTRPFGRRSPSNSAIISAPKARARASSRCLVSRILSPPRTACKRRFAGWATASGARPRRQAAGGRGARG